MNIRNILIYITMPIFVIGCLIVSYFIGSSLQFRYWEAIYSSTHNMTTGCTLNITPCTHNMTTGCTLNITPCTHNITTGCTSNITLCTDQLTCYNPFYRHCITGGVFGVIALLSSTCLCPLLLTLIISLISKNHTSDEKSVLVNSDDTIFRL